MNDDAPSKPGDSGHRGAVDGDAPTVIGSAAYMPGPAAASGEAEADIGGYRMIRKLGQGGMGLVYEAEQARTGRRVALKLLSPDLPQSHETAQRFLNEASLAASLSHPRTTFIYEAGNVGGDFFIAMELMPGGTLADAVREDGPMPPARAVDAAIDILDGLEAAHRAGVVHRDVKPSNCFLDAEGRVKVGDFGLSKSLELPSELTRTGAYLGTPQFSAPEQIRGGKVDGRTDLFAAAATLFFLIAGRAPFTGDAAAVIAQIVADDAPPLVSVVPSVPKALSKVVARGLARDPARRFRDAAEFRRALLPFSSAGASIADIGRRAAAFFIDLFLVGIPAGIVASALSIDGEDAKVGLFSTILVVTYFAVGEGLFGRTLGKRWLALRVCGTDGGPPGFGRALLRAAILPGAAWLVLDGLYLSFGTEKGTPSVPGSAPVDLWSEMVLPQLFSNAKYVLGLLLCATMRRSNGMRGLHELASGTQVMRLSGAEPIPEEPLVPELLPALAESSAGPFEITGRLGSGDSTVLLGRDPTLDRRVWIVRGEVGPERMNASRPTRQRWLMQGTDAEGAWHAFEAAEGAPLPALAATGTLRWPVSGRILVGLAEELAAAKDDGTLPEKFGPSQIWADARGRVHLLDRPPFGETSPDADALLREAAALCSGDERASAGALDLLLSLSHPAEGAGPDPAQAVADLHRALKLPHRFNWDDRLGVLAITASVEVALFALPVMLLAVGLRRAGLDLQVAVTCAMAAGVLAAAAFGFFAKGGLAFLLTKTRVRRATPGSPPASALRCAWRNALAWLPFAAMQAAIGLWLQEISTTTTPAGEVAVVARSGVLADNMAWLYTGFAMGAIGIVLTSSMLFALLHPRRGVQDVLAGTLLVRG